MKPILLWKVGRGWEVYLNTRAARAYGAKAKALRKYPDSRLLPVVRTGPNAVDLYSGAPGGKSPGTFTKEEASNLAHKIGRYMLGFGDLVFAYTEERTDPQSPEKLDAIEKGGAGDPRRRASRKSGRDPARYGREALEIVRYIQREMPLPYQLANKFSLYTSDASTILDMAASMLGPGGRGEEAYARAMSRVLVERDRKIMKGEKGDPARRASRKSTIRKKRTMRRDPTRKVFGPREAKVEVGKTYDVVTPESAEEGDFAESGWEFEPTMMTISEALREVRDLGAFEFADYPPTLRGGEGGYGKQLSLYESDGDTDYTTGAETRHALHIRGSEPAMRRFFAILKERMHR